MQEPATETVTSNFSIPGQLAATEVKMPSGRRKFTAEYKRRILAQVEGCERGALGALLRREGLYSSHIETWKRQQQEGLMPKKRGRKPDASREHKDELASLRKQNARLEKQLQQAQIIIEIQKKYRAFSAFLRQRTRHDELSCRRAQKRQRA